MELALLPQRPRSVRPDRLGSALDRDHLRVRLSEKSPAKEETALPPPAPYDEPFAYLAAVVRGTAPEDGLSSLATNLLVVEILDAAKQSIKEGKTVELPR